MGIDREETLVHLLGFMKSLGLGYDVFEHLEHGGVATGNHAFGMPLQA